MERDNERDALMPEGWMKLNKICRDPHESQIGREAAYLMKEMAEALEFYARPEQILGGSDYQYHATSSFRHATDDSGHKAMEALKRFKEWK